MSNVYNVIVKRKSSLKSSRRNDNQVALTTDKCEAKYLIPHLTKKQKTNN